MPPIPHHLPPSRAAADVVVIGAGISGAMMAEQLCANGLSVIILDRRPPLAGSTAASTALLQYEIDVPLTTLARKIGFDDAARVWQRAKLGLESLGAKIESLQIPCGMERRPTLYLSGNTLDAAALRREQAARNRIGLCTEYLGREALHAEYGLRKSAALQSSGSLTADPLRLAAGFLRAAVDCGARIYSPVTVKNVRSRTRGVTVETTNGSVITAGHLVFATGYEIPDGIKLASHRIQSTWAFATRPQAGQPWPRGALIWEASDPYLYLRTTRDGRIICGGEDEPFSDPGKRDALIPKKIAALQRKLDKLLPGMDTAAEYTWAGSFGTSRTGLPTIGRVPDMPRCYAVLAFGGNGITFSRIAAEMVAADMTGKPDPDAALFSFPGMKP